MPEQLQIVISADVVRAVGGFDTFVTKLKASNQEGQKFADGLTESFKKTEQTVKTSFRNIGVGIGAAFNKMRQQQNAVFAPGAGLDKFIAQTKQAEQATKNLGNTFSRTSAQMNVGNNVLINTGRIFQDLPFGIIGVANNINPLVESFQRLNIQAKETGVSIKSILLKSLIGGGGLGIAFSLVTAAMQFAVLGLSAFTRGMKSSKKAAEELVSPLKEMQKAAIADVANESARVSQLINFLKQETTTRLEKIAAIKELQRLAPEYFANLNAEKATIDQLTTAYGLYNRSLLASIETRVKEKQLIAIVERRLALEKELGGALFSEVVINGRRVRVLNAEYDVTGRLVAKQKELNNVRAEEQLLLDQLASRKPSELKIDVKTPKKLKELKDFTDEIIRRGKELAKFFEEILIVPQFSILDTKAEAFKKAKKFIDELAAGLITVRSFDLKITPNIVIDPSTIPSAADLLKTAIQKDDGTFILEPEFRLKEKSITDVFESFKQSFQQPFQVDLSLSPSILKQFDEIQSKFAAFGTKATEIFNKINTGNIVTDIELANEKFRQLNEQIFAANEVAGILSSSFGEMFEAITEGKNPVKAFFDSMIQSINQVIKKLIQAAIQAALLSAITGGAAGSFGSLFKGFLGVGGVAGGNLNALGGSISSRSFGNTFSVVVNGRVSGDQIILAGGRALASQGRTG